MRDQIESEWVKSNAVVLIKKSDSEPYEMKEPHESIQTTLR